MHQMPSSVENEEMAKGSDRGTWSPKKIACYIYIYIYIYLYIHTYTYNS